MNENSIIEQKKVFTQVNLKFLVAIFFSIFVSIWIALKADMPDSIGFGGFIYIIGPGLIGLFIMILYLIFSMIKPKWKIILGILSILLNIGIGFYYMLFV
jgi:hypothetical protein